MKRKTSTLGQISQLLLSIILLFANIIHAEENNISLGTIKCTPIDPSTKERVCTFTIKEQENEKDIGKSSDDVTTADPYPGAVAAMVTNSRGGVCYEHKLQTPNSSNEQFESYRRTSHPPNETALEVRVDVSINVVRSTVTGSGGLLSPSISVNENGHESSADDETVTSSMRYNNIDNSNGEQRFTSKSSTFSNTKLPKQPKEHEQYNVKEKQPPPTDDSDDIVVRIGDVAYERGKRYGREMYYYLNILRRDQTKNRNLVDDVNALVKEATTMVNIGTIHREQGAKGNLEETKLLESNAYDEAIKLYRHALEVARLSGNTEEIETINQHLASALVLLAETYEQNDDALLLYNEAEELYKLLENERTNLAKVFVLIGGIHLDRGTEGGYYGKEPTTDRNDKNNPKQQLFHSHYASPPQGGADQSSIDATEAADATIERALQKFYEALDIFRTMTQEEQVMEAVDHLTLLHNIGVARLHQQNQNGAIDAWLEGVSLYETIPDDMKEGGEDGIIAEIRLSLSDVYLQRGQYDETLKTYREAMQAYEILGEDEQIPRPVFTDNIMLNYYDTFSIDQKYESSPDQMLLVYKEELRSYRNQNSLQEDYDDDDDTYVADLLSMIAAIHIIRGENTQAMKHLTEALQIYRHQLGGQDLFVADTLITMSGIQLHQMKYNASYESYAKAIEIYKKHPVNNKDQAFDDLEIKVDGGSVHENLIELGDYREIINMTDISDFVE